MPSACTSRWKKRWLGATEAPRASRWGREIQKGDTMSEREVYHVTPDSREGWQVKLEGAQEASSLHGTKKEALARARELAKSLPLAQVIVHKQDGTIQTEYTYHEDPHPPEG